MKKLKLLPVDSPLVEVECGGVTERSQHIKDTKKNPNFPQPVFHFDVVSTVFKMLLSVLPPQDIYLKHMTLYFIEFASITCNLHSLRRNTRLAGT